MISHHTLQTVSMLAGYTNRHQHPPPKLTGVLTQLVTLTYGDPLSSVPAGLRLSLTSETEVNHSQHTFLQRSDILYILTRRQSFNLTALDSANVN